MLLSASDIATEAVLSSLLVLHLAQSYLLLNAGRTVIAHAADAAAQGDYQRADVSWVDIIRMRGAGAEHVALAALRRLGPDYYPHLFERITNRFNESIYVPNGHPAGQPAGTGAFPPNRLYELAVGQVTGQRVMSPPLGDVGNSQGWVWIASSWSWDLIDAS